MSKVAVVTAASKGIGAATATAFARNGYDVAINYNSDQGAAQEIVKAIEAAGRRAIAIKGDIFTSGGWTASLRRLTIPLAKLMSWSVMPVIPASHL